jgi:hypothetical protein
VFLAAALSSSALMNSTARKQLSCMENPMVVATSLEAIYHD